MRAEPKKSRPKALIGWCDPEKAAGAYADSIVRAIGRSPDLLGKRAFRIKSGPRVDDARQLITQTFLEKSSRDWLIQIDSDSVFDSFDFREFVERLDKSKPVVSGSIWMINTETGDPKCPAQTLDNEGVFNDFAWRNADGSPKTGLHEVDLVGGAMLAVHRSVFLEMREKEEAVADPENGHFPYANPWFGPLTIPQPQPDGAIRMIVVGEDYSFAMRARALGFPIYIDMDMQVGHVKSMTFAGVAPSQRDGDFNDLW